MHGGGSNVLTLAPYIPSQASSSTRTESTIFDQVYGGYRRRPATISLNVQWVPVADHLGTYQWNGGDVSSRKVKTLTFFGTGEMRGQQQAKVITPPGSDYTDAYLSAFASKSIPTRHIHQFNTAIFANSAPIPLKPTSTPLSTSTSMKTSQTRFINNNTIQTSNSFDKTVPSSSTRSSTYSSSFAPEKATTYEPFSNIQYSSPQSQTITSNYSSSVVPQRPTTYEPLSNTQHFPSQSQTITSSYSSSIAPEKMTTYEPLSRTQYSLPQSQTITSSYSSSIAPQRSTTYESLRSTPYYSSQPQNFNSSYSSSIAPEKMTTYEPLSSTRYFSPQSQTITSSYSSSVVPQRPTTYEPLSNTQHFSSQSQNFNSNYSSSLAPEKMATYEPLSSTQYSSPQSQSFTSSYSTLLRTPTLPITNIPNSTVSSQQPYTNFQTRFQPFLSTFPTVYRSEISYGDIYKPIPPYSIQAYPPSDTYTTSLSSSSTETAYKPYTSFQTTPLSSSYNFNQSSTNERIVLPTSTIEKQIDRPETLLFQHDEDIRSSQIAKQSPILSPLPESPITHEEPKVESENLNMEELPATTSEPFQILENTLSKYDALINQISEVLASVSPLTSTVGSISPDKSVLDYQLSSDSSPILPHKHIESQSTQQSSTAVKSSSIQRTKPSHLIREDSYDKIVTVMSDLDNQITSSTDVEKASEIAKAEKEQAKSSLLDQSRISSITEEEKIKPHIPLLDEYELRSETEQPKDQVVTPIISSEGKEDAKILSSDEHQVSSVVEEDTDETKITAMKEQQSPHVTHEEAKISSLDEHQTSRGTEEDKNKETLTASIVEQQTTPTLEEVKEETKTSFIDEPQTSSTSITEQKDNEPTAVFTDEHQVPSVSKEEKEEKEEAKIVSTNEHQTSSIAEEEKNEETTTTLAHEQQVPSVTEQKDKESTAVFTDEHQVPSISKEEKEEEEAKIVSTNEYQTSSIAEEEKKEETTTTLVHEHPPTVFTEEKKEEIDEHQLPLVSEKEKEEAKFTSLEERRISSTTEKENEESKIQSSDEHETSSTVKTKEEETKISSSDEQQAPSVVPEEPQILPTTPPSDISTNETVLSSEAKFDEEKIADNQPTAETTSENTEFIQQETGLLTSVPTDIPVPEETQKTSDDVTTIKRTEKHVTWDETVVDNEEDENSLQQTFVGDNITSDASTTITPADNNISATTEKDHMTTDETKTIVDQQTMIPDITTPQITSESSIALPSTVDQQGTLPVSDDTQMASTEQQLSSSSHSEDQINLQVVPDEQTHPTDMIEQQVVPSDFSERHIKSSSSFETSSTISDSTEQQIISSDLNEPKINLDEQQIRSASPIDTQSISITDSSKEDTFTVDEVSTTISDEISNEELNKSMEEVEKTKTESEVKQTIDEHKDESPAQVVDNVIHKSEVLAAESITPSIQPTIVSAIDTLTDTISNRYISSDVYHGYLGDHKQFLQDVSDIDNDSTTKSLLTSLRETITAPITPLIETIQTVVSSIQTTTTTTTHPLKSESEATDHTQDETKLTTDLIQESKEQISDDKSHIEEHKSTVDTSEESKTIFESLREAVTTPITAITDTIQTVVSNFQSDNQEVPSTSSTEQLTTTLEENLPTVGTELPSDSIKSSDEKTDVDSNKEIEQTQSSLFDNIQEKVSKTITTLTETIQNVVSTDVSSKETHTEDEQVVQQEKLEAQPFEHTVLADIVHDQTITHAQSPDNIVTDTTVSTSSNITSSTAEELNKQKEKQETITAESLPSKISDVSFDDQKLEESTTETVEHTPVAQYDEQVLTSTAVPFEQIDVTHEQQAALSETSEIIPTDQKADEISLPEDMTSERTLPTSITEPDQQVLTGTVAPSEKIDVSDKQQAPETTTAIPEDSSETITEQKSDASVSTETKTTLETIRDVITHPIATITETIQSITPISTSEHIEKTTTDTTKSSEETETLRDHQVLHTENIAATEYTTDWSTETENVESTETKSTLETLRDVITHPITTITEKIQSVISTSTDEHVENIASDVTKPSVDTSEQTESLEKQPSLETTETSTIEQKPDSIVETENIESTETKSTFETLRDVITHPIATITEKLQSVISTSTDEHAENIASDTTKSSTDTSEQTESLEKQSSLETTETSTIEQKPDSTVETENIESTETKSTLETLRDVITHPITTITEKIQSVISTSTDEHAENIATDTTKSSIDTSEQTEGLEKQSSLETTETSIIEQKPDSTVETENVESTETKSTLETLRDVITHPITTITEKLQSVISTSTDEHAENIATDVTKSSIDTSEQTESLEKQPSLETTETSTIEQKPDSTVETENVESTETKSTFETLRDVITHPIATITEKIQSVISSSTTEDVSSSEQTAITPIDLTKAEDITSITTESTFKTSEGTITNLPTTISETIQDVASNTISQTPSSEEQEQTLTTQGSESLTQGQIQGEDEINSTTLPSQISDDKKISQRTASQSEDTINTEIQELISHKPDITTTDELTSDINKLLLDTVRDLINDAINTVVFRFNRNLIEDEHINQEIFSSDSGLTSPITVINVADRSESSQSITNQNTLINDEDIHENSTSVSDVTWTGLEGERTFDEEPEHSFDEIKQLLEEVVQSSDNITVEITEQKTIITLPHQTQSLPIIENIIQQTIIKPQIDDIMQQSTHELESDSTSGITEIEKFPSKPSTDFREASPTNTEDDSLELMQALQGHSIIHSSSPTIQTQTITTEPSVITTFVIEKTEEHVLQAPEKSSSSTTTSSQVTSSDRYVSYAIHEMGDSSQERLPALPIAADIPIYKLVQTTSDENKEQKMLSEPIINVNQTTTKDDDLTELDATENLTSYSDDIVLQKLYASAPNREKNLDASSTDEDVDDENFNEFEQHDVSNLHRIFDEITQHSNSLSGGYGETYQRYDISSNSSTSTKPQTDDIYIIPGYPGLWRPSADDDDSRNSPLANDADDEDEKKQSVTKIKTRTIVRTTDPSKLQSFLQQQHQDIATQDIPLRPDTIDIFNRPLNEFSFDISESDSFKTCASTINSSSISKQQKQSETFQLPISEQQEHQTSPDEKIFLIRERERGVSLPVTMKIDCDDMALRLSTSTPIEAPLYSTMQTDLPSTYHETIQKTTSSSRASTPSISSNESDQQKLPSSSSWLNTINTITTTTEGPDGPLESRTTIHKSAKGPISIAECDAQGKYIVIENTSRSKSIALAHWILRQENDNGEVLTFTFPDNCLLRPNHSIKVLTKANESERRNGDLIASLLSSWHTGSNVVTTLINAEGKDRASLTKKTIFS